MSKRKDGQRRHVVLPEERNVLIRNRKSVRVIGGVLAVLLVTVGVFAKNGWFPSTNPFTGKRTGWFGQPPAGSSWNSLGFPLPTPTPQLAKEYIYAGSRPSVGRRCERAGSTASRSRGMATIDRRLVGDGRTVVAAGNTELGKLR